MRITITLVTCFLALLSIGQSASITDLFLMDPKDANGYFIIDQTKADNLGVQSVDIKVFVHEFRDPEVITNLAQEISITTQHYGRIDAQLLNSLGDTKSIDYEIVAKNGSGNVVLEVNRLDEPPPPLVCSKTCISTNYAWRVNGYSFGANTVMDVTGVAGNYFYLFKSDWPAFLSQWDASEFGFAGDWNNVLPDSPYLYPNNALRFIEHPSKPDGARDVYGFFLNGAGAVYAIHKDMGPWRGFYSWTEGNYAQPGQICLNLVEHFNDDWFVQGNLESQNLPPLTCEGIIADGTGGGWSCTSIDVQGDLNNWVQEVLDCLGDSDLYETVLADVHSLSMVEWSPNGPLEVFYLQYPSEDDPRLVEVPRTVLEPGLYEVAITLHDGRRIRHFQSNTEQIVFHASFASFVGITIYPVPVTDHRFAIDFDLVAPVNINTTIVNNMGVPFYTQALQFERAGTNKHVVEMTSTWPSGLYHAIFQYADGSSHTVSFTVDI